MLVCTLATETLKKNIITTMADLKLEITAIVIMFSA